VPGTPKYSQTGQVVGALQTLMHVDNDLDLIGHRGAGIASVLTRDGHRQLVFLVERRWLKRHGLGLIGRGLILVGLHIHTARGVVKREQARTSTHARSQGCRHDAAHRRCRHGHRFAARSAQPFVAGNRGATRCTREVGVRLGIELAVRLLAVLQLTFTEPGREADNVIVPGAAVAPVSGAVAGNERGSTRGGQVRLTSRPRGRTAKDW
jgi:hypothetical protein